MGCGGIEDTFRDVAKNVKTTGRDFRSGFDDLRRGDFTPLGGKDERGRLEEGIKEGWDDARGATARKAAENAAREADVARMKAATYQRGAKASPRKTEKAGSGRGARGTRLVRQPLGSYTPPT